MRSFIWLGVLTILLVGCSAGVQATPNSTPGTGEMETGMGGGMMARHHAQIPAAYAGVTNPVPVGDESFARGAATYATHCASCHGDGGMGDGPAGVALDPAPSPIAHTSQMMGDDYLFWRISDGSGQFSTSMPAWKDTLEEQERWDVINYIRALGKGEVKPASQVGGVEYDADLQAKRQAEMLVQAVAQNIITQAEAEIFDRVHTSVEHYQIEHPELVDRANDATEREALVLAELVKTQAITQEQAQAFPDIHDRLGNAGLMP